MNPVFSQSIEEGILTEILQYYTKQNEFYLLKQKVGDVVVVEDPINGDVYFNISDKNSIDKTYHAKFNKLNTAEKKQVINQYYPPIFPLKDTLVLIDTLGFFMDAHIVFNESYCLAAHREYFQSKSPALILFAIGIRSNLLIVSFLSVSDRKIINHYFEIKDNKLKLVQVRSLNNDKVYE